MASTALSTLADLISVALAGRNGKAPAEPE
jgi:hypothetical protein